MGIVLRQAIFETELERGIERNLWWKIEKTKGEGNVAKKKRKKKEIKKRVTSGGVIVDILDIVEADLRGVSVDNLCLGISVIA